MYHISKNQNTIYVKRKPAIGHILSNITSFREPDTKEVTSKARGRATTTAVDVAEIVRHRFIKDLNASEITIGTEEIQQEEGGTRNVSTIEIELVHD